MKTLIAALVATTALGAGLAEARTLRVEFTNTSATDGVFFTPVLGVFHDGSYDAFDNGAAASPELELIAEDGFVAGFGDATGELQRAEGLGFSTGVGANPAGFGGAPVIDPGETTVFDVDVGDVAGDLFFSFLTMVIPSNDIFIGNDDPLAFQVFDSAGNFVLDDPIEVRPEDAYDAGTELNDGFEAAFTPGFSPILGNDENGVVTGVDDLDFLADLRRANDGAFLVPPAADAVFARISVTEVAPVPLPAGGVLLLGGLGLMGAMRARRRKG